MTSLAEDFHPQYGGGRSSISAYDTSWLLWLRSPENAHDLRHPAALNWLVDHQASDGSWGGPYPYCMMPTLAVLLGLAQMPRELLRQHANSINNAEQFLRANCGGWNPLQVDMIGIEVIVPFLLDKLRALNHDFKILAEPDVRAARKKKLDAVNFDNLGQQGMALLNSAEALMHLVPADALSSLQSVAGHIGSSVPATVAWLLRCGGNRRAEQWLAHVLAMHDGVSPIANPLETFTAAFAMYFLQPLCAALDPALLNPVLNRLETALTPTGASWSVHSGIQPDGDDTAVVITVLSHLRRPWQIGALNHFIAEDNLVSYVGERTHSATVAAHCMEAAMCAQPATSTDRILDIGLAQILRMRRFDGSFGDKWCSSPFYASQCVIQALLRHPGATVRNEALPSIRWTMDAQRTDGGWGHDFSNAEETAYAILALRHAAHVPGTRAAAQTGQSWLTNHLHAPRPDLWIYKSLYTPIYIAEAAITSALEEPL